MFRVCVFALLLALLFVGCGGGPVCGDVNGDGVVDLDDVRVITDYLFAGGDCPDRAVADVNCDGNIDILDADLLRAHINRGESLACCE